MDRIVVVGAGQAAHCAAVALRAAGYDGGLLMLGDEGCPPYERPPLSKAVLRDPESFALPCFVPPDRYRSLGIDLRPDAAVAAIDPQAGQVVLGSGARLGFDRLLLATGARARPLDVPGGDAVACLRTMADARALGAELVAARRVVCIGGGVIGLEVAASARQIGAEVTVLEAGPRLMGRAVSAEVAALLQQRHEAEGVRFRFGVEVVAVEGRRGAPRRVRLGGGEEITADCVLAGVGIARNDSLAAAAGIATDDGILVDGEGRTDTPGVFAAGDVAAFLHPLFGRLRLESYFHAQAHGTAVGRAMAGSGAGFADVPRFWTDQYDLNLQVAGLPDRGERVVWRREAGQDGSVMIQLDRQGRVVAGAAFNAAREMRPLMALIAARAAPGESALIDPAIALSALARGRTAA